MPLTSSPASLARRSTRGPLDINDSPLIPSSPTSPSTPRSSQLLSPSSTTGSQFPSQPRTPRLPSPTPGSNLSFATAQTSPSFRTAASTLSTTPSLTQKDFSYLLRPEVYHPLTLLDVPPPFRVSSVQPDPTTPLSELVRSGHFRSAAIKAAQLLTTPLTSESPSSGEDYARIFELVYTRLACLTLCNQTALAAQEVKVLEDLNSHYYRDGDGIATHLVPWELRVLAVRLQGMGFNDARRGVMGYYDLAREARLNLTALKKQRKEDGGFEEEIKLWESRLADLGIRVASALVEMEDLEGATRHLQTLKPVTGDLQLQKALLWLCVGDVDAARSCIGDEDENVRNVVQGLAFMADGNYSDAVKVFEALVTSGSGDEDVAMYKQNLGVCLLYCGKMDEARTILSSLVDDSHSFHALTFNLSTIYELCTERSRALKIGLAEQVAQIRHSGQGMVGWEKVNGDFKL
ncbi:hypothetical protein D0Z07_3868 [Hyphodiscus hymeniophilus]|uniref:Tetratricopeptide repeat protein 15 n=1 Tax=Hyphodiscus hymeniophilus TaxID=353542 RepID=A0A9P6VKM1_9HELO|nr:hypothetical protein D0Z07_3868 [Hyphodiscus hymeniophilus]